MLILLSGLATLAYIVWAVRAFLTECDNIDAILKKYAIWMVENDIGYLNARRK